MNNFQGRIRPAGESSEEDEFDDYVSENNGPRTRQIVQDINRQQFENERIFQLFLSRDLPEIIRLLDGGFDVNKRLRDDWTPLLLAASVGIPEVTNELISRGADVNLHRDYYTPLMAAAACPQTTSPETDSLAVVRQLLEKNVNVNAKTRKRMTAFMYAASIGNCAIVKELLPLCDKMAEDNQGWTALFWAVNGNSIEVVKFLLREDLPYDKFDIRGNLPVYYATQNGFNSIIEILPSLKEEDNQYDAYKEYGYRDFFENGSTDFIQDVVTMLYGMRNERRIESFINNGVNLFKLLTLDEDDLKNLNIKMPCERYQILSNLYKFHKHPFKMKGLPIVGKTEAYSTLNIGDSLLSACRQLTVMKASVRYILMSVKDSNEISDIDKELTQIRESLHKIRLLANRLNEKVSEWDLETRPADLITKDSLKIFRVSKFKMFTIASVLSLIGFVIWKRLK